jgi:hypothetical protein
MHSMNISRDELRQRLASIPDDELEQIALSDGGTHTDAAREVAQQIRAERASAAPAADKNAGGAAVAGRGESYAIEEAMLAVPRRGWELLRSEARRAWHALVPEVIPGHIRGLFLLGVSAAAPAVGLGILAILRLLKLPSASSIFADHAVFATGTGVAGALLAYGVRTQKRYPQYLGAVVVMLVAVEAILTDEVTLVTGIIAAATAGFASLRYLFRDEEATEYYRAMETRRSEARARLGSSAA